MTSAKLVILQLTNLLIKAETTEVETMFAVFYYLSLV